jgi:uncharacterized protein (TIGR02117 family)
MPAPLVQGCGLPGTVTHNADRGVRAAERRLQVRPAECGGSVLGVPAGVRGKVKSMGASAWRFRPRSTAFAMLCLFCLLAVITTRCTAPPLFPVETKPRDEVIYVIRGGWHTELALPRSAIGSLLPARQPGVAQARYLVFGWGARDYYMARDPALADLLRAVVPGPAVLLVIPLRTSPATFAGAANTFAVLVSPGGARRLSRFLWEYLAKDAQGTPHPVGAGPYPGSVFYASTGTFDLAHTCNTWTAEALHVAGVPVTSVGIVYAAQLLDQLPRVAASATSGPEARERRRRLRQLRMRDCGVKATRGCVQCAPHHARVCTEGRRMPGRPGLPGGEPRKASQRNIRGVGAASTRIAMVCQPGSPVHWKGRTGGYCRDVGDCEHAEIVIGERFYRVQAHELG